MTATSLHPESKPAQRSDIHGWLIHYLANQMALAPEELDPTVEVTSYGVSSIAAVSLAGDLEDWLDIELSPEFAWEYPTIEGMTDHLCSLVGIAT